MEWIKSISDAISFIEDNITEDFTVDEIADAAFLSPYYFQKGFTMLCGFTVSEYVRLRRLTLAGTELVSSDKKIIDIALKYGYDSPDSFTKAFTRFHGVTPTAIRRDGAMIKSFAPLKIKFSLEGGFIMDYRIVDKDAFTVMGVSRMFKYDSSSEIPMFWSEHFKSENAKVICGMYGVCIDEPDKSEFEYLIADNYMPCKDIPNGFVTRVIPKHTWAVFPCKGPMPNAIQDTNTKIFSEWLPNCKEYEIADGYNIELYTDISDYPKGNQDENYYSEIWIPVKKK
ncbi:MAG: AraC family transcriptional regulator [Clostridiales bacterium]|jgi:AraC family transcriptional regulator|nr:AraC family transcriptional regulator [Clostridiales bacterium]